MKKIAFLCVMMILICISLSVKAQTGVPIMVTGFNNDLIANGSGMASASTTSGFDNDLSFANVFYVAGFNCGSAGPLGLPSNGVINSMGTSGVTYQLADYASNNALLLIALNQQGTLTFQNPGSFAKLSVLASSAGTPGSPTSFNVQVNFSDGSNQVYPFTVADWCVPGITPTYAIQHLGRVTRDACSFDDVGVNGVSMYDCFIILDTPDQAKVVTSITFTKTVVNDRSGIFAVCGITAVGTPPAVVATAATSVTSSGFAANWDAAATATKYYLDVSTSNEFSTLVSPYNNYDVGNVTTFNITGLSSCTDYYYRIRGANGNGQGPNSNIILVTTSCAPAAPVATAATNISTTSFDANWDASATATGYRLDVATDAGFSNFVTGYNDKVIGNVFTSPVTGLSPGTTYHYRIRAVNGSGTSLNSNVIDPLTLDTPNIQASYILFPDVQNTQMSVSWTNGNGAKRVVFAIKISSGGSSTALPVNRTTYTANTIYGDGTQIGTSGWYCIYNGNGTGVIVTGLTPNSNYRFMVCEYNGSAGSEYYNTNTANNNPFEIPSVPISNWAIILGILLITIFIVFRFRRNLVSR